MSKEELPRTVPRRAVGVKGVRDGVEWEGRLLGVKEREVREVEALGKVRDKAGTKAVMLGQGQVINADEVLLFFPSLKDSNGECVVSLVKWQWRLRERKEGARERDRARGK